MKVWHQTDITVDHLAYQEQDGDIPSGFLETRDCNSGSRGHSLKDVPDFGRAARRVQGQQLPSAAVGALREARKALQHNVWEKTMEPNPVPHDTSHELADDLLRGADAIAEFIFGAQASRRKVYYLAETSRLPVFRLGSTLCARRSVLMRWISGQESKARS